MTFLPVLSAGCLERTRRNETDDSIRIISLLPHRQGMLKINFLFQIKDKVEFWSCDCIVKEKVWNGSEKVDHVACKYWCVLQGSGVIKIIINLAQSW